MSFTSKQPYEYRSKNRNQEHREKMRWVLQDIRNTQYCDACGKMIMKYIYSMRRSDMICCSMECVDNMQ